MKLKLRLLTLCCLVFAAIPAFANENRNVLSNNIATINNWSSNLTNGNALLNNKRNNRPNNVTYVVNDLNYADVNVNASSNAVINNNPGADEYAQSAGKKMENADACVNTNGLNNPNASNVSENAANDSNVNGSSGNSDGCLA